MSLDVCFSEQSHFTFPEPDDKNVCHDISTSGFLIHVVSTVGQFFFNFFGCLTDSRLVTKQCSNLTFIAV